MGYKRLPSSRDSVGSPSRWAEGEHIGEWVSLAPSLSVLWGMAQDSSCQVRLSSLPFLSQLFDNCSFFPTFRPRSIISSCSLQPRGPDLSLLISLQPSLILSRSHLQTVSNCPGDRCFLPVNWLIHLTLTFSVWGNVIISTFKIYSKPNEFPPSVPCSPLLEPR